MSVRAATVPPLPTGDELITIALGCLDRVALRIGLSADLGEVERHADLADLGAAYAALCTHRTLRTRERA